MLITYTFYKKKDLINQIDRDFKFKKGISIIQKSINLRKVKKVKYKISLIKVDVNGHELSVIKGLENIIRKDRPVLIIETDNKINKIEFFLKKLKYKKYSFSKNKNKFENIKNEYPLNTYFLQNSHLR